MVRIHVALQQFLDHLRPVALRRQNQWGGTGLVQVVHLNGRGREGLGKAWGRGEEANNCGLNLIMMDMRDFSCRKRECCQMKCDLNPWKGSKNMGSGPVGLNSYKTG